MTNQKATHEQLKRHNRQLLLRAVSSGLASSRAALAQATGLAKPTVSNLITELIDDGLLSEGGHGPSTDSGGKRPRLLEFNPGARQVIGVSVEHDRVLGVLVDLSGKVFAHHFTEVETDEDVKVLVPEVINGLIAQLDAPLLCLGVGVPGSVDSHSETVGHSARPGWRQLELAARLSERYGVPTYVGNSTELCALAQLAFGRVAFGRLALQNGGTSPRRLVTVLVGSSVEVGVTLEGGAYHYGGDISSLRAPYPQSIQSEVAPRLDTLMSWEEVQRRVAGLRQRHPETNLPEENLTYLHVRYSAAQGDPAALELIDELASKLAGVAAWVVGLLQPDYLSLAGPIAELGPTFLERLVDRTRAVLAPELLDTVTFSLAHTDSMSAVGAAALALQKELALL